MRPLFFVEGNDGLGKTHFLKDLMKRLKEEGIHNVIYISKPTGFMTDNYKNILSNDFNYRRYLDKIKSNVIQKEDKFNYFQAMNKNIDNYISLLRRDYLILLDRTNLSNEIYNDNNYVNIMDEFEKESIVYGMFFQCPNMFTDDFMIDQQEYDEAYIKKIEMRYQNYYQKNLSNNNNIGLIEVINSSISNYKLIKNSVDLFLETVKDYQHSYNYLGV